jgi:hypothetical protein
MPSVVELDGFSDLAKALAATGPEVRRMLRDNLEAVAAPVARDAEQFAQGGIPRIGMKWWQMRVGMTRNFTLVYVAPRQQGVKSRGIVARRRPKFATLMRDRAMAPALARNTGRIIRDVERLVDNATSKWWR